MKSKLVVPLLILSCSIFFSGIKIYNIEKEVDKSILEAYSVGTVLKKENSFYSDLENEFNELKLINASDDLKIKNDSFKKYFKEDKIAKDLGESAYLMKGDDFFQKEIYEYKDITLIIGKKYGSKEDEERYIYRIIINNFDALDEKNSELVNRIKELKNVKEAERFYLKASEDINALYYVNTKIESNLYISQRINKKSSGDRYNVMNEIVDLFMMSIYFSFAFFITSSIFDLNNLKNNINKSTKTNRMSMDKLKFVFRRKNKRKNEVVKKNKELMKSLIEEKKNKPKEVKKQNGVKIINE